MAPDLMDRARSAVHDRAELPGMSLMEHLDELRRRLLWSMLFLVFGCIVAWALHNPLNYIIQKPLMGIGLKMAMTHPTDAINYFIKTSLVFGAIFASPLILYQVWLFISPGMYANEKKYVMPFMGATVFLFLAGAWFGYRYVLPGAMVFLIQDLGKNFTHVITIDDYTGFFMSVILGLGITFELPIVIFFLALFGIVDAKFLLRHFRYAILAIFIVAGVLCPDPSPVGMTIFATPMLALYFIGVLVAYLVHPSRRNKKNAGASRMISARTLLRTLTLALLGITTAHAQAHHAAAVTGAEVLQLTQQYLDAAPKRYIGSAGHTAAENFIKAHFRPEAAKGDFIDDAFTARTPIGYLTMHNLLVKFPSTNPAKKNGIIVLASHYETNYWLKDINFVGANDGACTTALLIALGQHFRDHPPQGYSIWLLFTDGEESIDSNWTDSDSLYGTRHIAAKWDGDGTLGRIKAFVLADMIGWKNMNITRELNSTPWLEDLLAKAARDTGHSKSIFRQSMAIDDDHIPFKQRGVPVLDIIDYQYGTPADPEAFHHTAQDTLDKLSAQSLQTSADLFLEVIKLIDQR